MIYLNKFRICYTILFPTILTPTILITVVIVMYKFNISLRINISNENFYPYLKYVHRFYSISYVYTSENVYHLIFMYLVSIVSR